MTIETSPNQTAEFLIVQLCRCAVLGPRFYSVPFLLDRADKLLAQDQISAAAKEALRAAVAAAEASISSGERAAA